MPRSSGCSWRCLDSDLPPFDEVRPRTRLARRHAQGNALEVLGGVVARRPASSSTPAAVVVAITAGKFHRPASRPVILLGEGDEATALFGAYQIGASAWYLLEGIQSGWFSGDFFTSMEMRRYIGSVAEWLGHAFTQTAASALSASGWEVRTEIQMRTFGAPKALGDLDIIAWHTRDPRVLLIGCKRLQPARNPGEIVERLNQFRGVDGDRLGKHLRRCEWITENVGNVQKALRLPGNAIQLIPVLMTNSGVPMQYKRDLALPPEQIVSLSEISERLQPDPGSK